MGNIPRHSLKDQFWKCLNHRKNLISHSNCAMLHDAHQINERNLFIILFLSSYSLLRYVWLCLKWFCWWVKCTIAFRKILVGVPFVVISWTRVCMAFSIIKQTFQRQAVRQEIVTNFDEKSKQIEIRWMPQTI